MSELFEVRLVSSKGTLAALDTGQRLYLLLELRPSQKRERAQPLNLALVVDCSTSMQGGRLAQVKAATTSILDELAADDLLSVVAFNDRAHVVRPADTLENKATVSRRIHNIVAEGGTEIFQGLAAAMKQLSHAPLKAYTNHLILLTDGHTYGDEALSLKAVRAAAERGIGLTALGIGADWNERFLDELVMPSGGQAAYLADLGQLTKELRRRVRGLGQVYASNVRLLHRSGDGVTLEAAFKVRPFVQPLLVGTEQTGLGQVEQDGALTVLLEFVIPPRPEGATVTIPLAFVADVPAQGETARGVPAAEKRVTVPIKAESVAGPPPKCIVEAVRLLNFHRMTEKAWDDYEAGNVERATRRMEQLTTRLQEAGYTRLAGQMQDETRRLASKGTMSAEGRKQLHFGTRVLLPSTVDLERES